MSSTPFPSEASVSSFGSRTWTGAALAAGLAWMALGLMACSGGDRGEDVDAVTGADQVEDVGGDPGPSPDLGETDACQPACAQRECGNDGCGGTCGACATGKECNSEGECILKGCNTKADCDGKCSSLSACEECTCESKRCVTKDKAGCCEDDAGCEDGEACAEATHTCYLVCANDGDCKDRCGTLTACDRCACGGATGDQCAKSTIPAPACCLGDSDCVGEQVCTNNTCASKPVVCSGARDPRAACAGQCGLLGYCQTCGCDLDTDACVKLTAYGDACCTDAILHCDDANEATLDECPSPGAPCVHKPNPSACATGAPVTYFSATFDQGSLAQFEVYADNAPDDSVTWQLDANAPHSGAYALYFGDPVCHTYYTGALGPDCRPLDLLQGDATAVRARARTKEIVLGSASDPCAYALLFWARLEGEEAWVDQPSLTFDQLRVFVQQGAATEPIFASAVATGTNSTNGAWRLFAADLTGYWGQSIRIVFEFDSIDGNDNLHYGVAIDDVVVRSMAGSSPCAAGNCASDGKACTNDACTVFSNGPVGTGLCGYVKDDASCEDCSTDLQCNGGGACEVGSCSNQACTYALDVACCKTVLEGTTQKWDFGSGLNGWTVTGGNDPAVTWHAAPGKGVDGTGAAYFGDPLHACPDDPGTLCPSYGNGQAVVGSLESEPMVLPSGSGFRLLSFDLWLSTEWDGTPLAEFSNPTGVDRLTLSVRVGSTLSPLWTSDLIAGSTAVVGPGGTLHPEFRKIGLDVSAFSGMAASFVFTFDSGEYLQNDYEGAYLDNVAVIVGCEPPCSGDAGCSDSKPCTKDTCQAGICVHEITGECCTNKEDCDDGNACTIDTCLNGLCKHPYLVDPGCCQDGTITGSVFDFESGALPASAVVDVPAGSAVTWQVSDAKAKTGAHSLWFGNAQTGTYENVAASGTPLQAVGTIAFPSFKVPVGGLPVLEFDVYLDSEWVGIPALWELPIAGFGFDKLTALANGVEVWNSFVYELAGSTCGAGCAFQAVQASLAAFAGQDVTLAFRFDSLDGEDNAHAGAFLDDVRVHWTCADHECFSSFECDDTGDPDEHCTQDRCVNKQCFFQPTGETGCCYPLDVKTDGFEGAVPTVTLSGGSGAVKWQVLGESEGGRVHGGVRSLYFGDAANKTYANAANAVSGEASWSVEVPAGLGHQVEWWQWLGLDVADTNVTVSDVFRVRIFDPANPTAPNVIFENKPTYGLYRQWARQGVSLDAFAGKSVVVVFSFASGDGQNNAGEGLYVDDLRVFKACD